MRLPLPTMRLLDAWLLFALALATAAVAASPKKSRERLVSRCEYKALKVGSDLADAFNAPIGDEVGLQYAVEENKKQTSYFLFLNSHKITNPA